MDFVTTGQPMADPDLLTWLALRRVHRGGVAVVSDVWVYRGRATPGYLRDGLDDLAAAGLLVMTDVDGQALQRVSLTEAGKLRWAQLCHPDPPLTPAGVDEPTKEETVNDQGDGMRLGPGRRISGEERARVTTELTRRYVEGGATLRELERATGRSYGFVHRILTEAGVLRPRGAAGRPGRGTDRATERARAAMNQPFPAP